MKYNYISELIKDLEAYRSDAFKGEKWQKKKLISLTTGTIELLNNLNTKRM